MCVFVFKFNFNVEKEDFQMYKFPDHQNLYASHLHLLRTTRFIQNFHSFYHPQNILSRQIMKPLIVHTPPVPFRYLHHLRANYKNIFWNYSAFFAYLNYFRIFQYE